MHMRAIRAIMNEAKKAGVIRESQYPFGKDRYEIQTGESRKKALTLEQIRHHVHGRARDDGEVPRPVVLYVSLQRHQHGGLSQIEI